VAQFALFDLDKDNYIDYHELKVALKALGFDLPKPDLLEILTLSGVPASSVHPPAGSAKAAAPSSAGPPSFTGPNRRLLSLQAFQMHTAALIAARDPRTEIERAFDLFDVDGKGMISLPDLRRVARELGEGLQEEELAAMIEEFDMDGDGMISKEEFIGICLG
jgi:centrin-3